MLNLKEAGRYSNYLNSTIETLVVFPNQINGKLIKKTENHKRSVSVTEAQDELKDILIASDYDVELETVESAIAEVIKEKVKLANAIAEAKKNIVIAVGEEVYALDSAIEYAKMLRNVTDRFYYPLENKKDSLTETVGKGKKINVEGNQVPYEYPVEVKVELLFDKDKVKATTKELKQLANKLSLEIESNSSIKVIDFEPKFDYLDTIEEMFSKI